jgi:hypothetical protein
MTTKLQRIPTRLLLGELGTRLDFGADCDVNYAQPPLHGLIADLPDEWTAARRDEWLKCVGLAVDLRVKVLAAAPVEGEEEK